MLKDITCLTYSVFVPIILRKENVFNIYIRRAKRLVLLPNIKKQLGRASDIFYLIFHTSINILISYALIGGGGGV